MKPERLASYIAWFAVGGALVFAADSAAQFIWLGIAIVTAVTAHELKDHA
jgi:hypothetical protein